MVLVALEDLGGEAEAEALGVVFRHAALGVAHELDFEFTDALAGLRVLGVAIGVAVGVAAGAGKIPRFAERVEAVAHVPLVRGHHVGEPGMPAAVAVATDGRRGDAVGAGGGRPEVGLIHADAADFMDFLQRSTRETLGQRLVGFLAGRSLRWLGAGHEVHAVVDHRVGFAPVVLLVGRREFEFAQVVLLERPFHFLGRGFGADHPDEFVRLEPLEVGLEALALRIVPEVAVALKRVDAEGLALGVAGPAETELLVEDQGHGELQVDVLAFEFLRVIGHEFGPDLDGFTRIILRLYVGEELFHQRGVGHEVLQERQGFFLGDESA